MITYKRVGKYVKFKKSKKKHLKGVTHRSVRALKRRLSDQIGIKQLKYQDLQRIRRLLKLEKTGHTTMLVHYAEQHRREQNY